MFRNPIGSLKNVSWKLGQISGQGYRTIRKVEHKINEFDKGFGGVPGEIWRMTPFDMTYRQISAPTKLLLKTGEKVFGSLGSQKVNRRGLVEGVLGGIPLVSNGNDFLANTVNSQMFNSLYSSPYIQNYIGS